MNMTETSRHRDAGESAPEGIRFDVTDNPEREDATLIDQTLESFNQTAAPLHSVRRPACFARLADGRVIGGAVARTWGQCCELQQIWVDDEHRRRGIGLQLARRVEAEARTRGCILVYLETFSFQAPAFYRRLGYQTACEFNGFPDGIVKYTMCKSL